MTLTEFVTARLDEDEAAAEAAKHSPILGAIQAGRRNGKATAHAHIARHDPARVLAQVAAMRGLLEMHPGATDEDECPGCGADLMGRWRTGPGETCPTLRHLAAIWSDHDDYDPAWAPEGE